MADCDTPNALLHAVKCGADLLSTTCREYLKMDEPTRREVITAIGESGNKFIAGNPELWAGVAGALCGFVDPSAPVKDIILGMR